MKKAKSGYTTVSLIIIVFGLFVLLSIFIEYVIVKTSIMDIKYTLNSACTSIVDINKENTYNGLREENTKHSDIDINIFYDQIEDELGLKKENGNYVKKIDDEVLYIISDININNNTENIEDAQYKVTGTVNLTYYTNFAGFEMPISGEMSFGSEMQNHF